eukprot:scaffold1884_cov343-Ochromonas_danica.AAC.18
MRSKAVSKSTSSKGYKLLFFLFHAAWFHSIFSRFENLSVQPVLSDRPLRLTKSSVSTSADVTPTATAPGLRVNTITTNPPHLEGSDVAHLPLSEETSPSQVVIPPSKVEVSGSYSTIKPTLPGAKDRPVLTLSDEELAHTTLDEMISWYGEADGGGSCANDFGYSLIKRWQATKAPYCPATTQTKSPPKAALQSSINCYLVHQTRHHGNGDNICHMKNVAVDMKIFTKESVTTPVIEKYVQTQHFQQPYIPFPSGFIQGDCEVDGRYWKASNMPGWNADLTVKAFQKISSDHAIEQCEVWIDHPVLITQRDTFANFFHDSEDFVNVFIAMAVLKWSPGNTQQYLTDLYPRGAFWDMWSRVYSHSPEKPALTAWDLREKFSGTTKRVCFKELAVGIYGPAAPITVASWDTPCSNTALVKAYADFVIRSLGLHTETHYAQEKPSQTIRITYMARRASVEWPEKAFCDDNNSFFKCKYWARFGLRKLGRMIRNDAEVVAGLKSLEAEYASKGLSVEFKDADYNKMSLRDQIATDVATDIMIGPHGAGLMHSVFIRGRGQLIELFVDGSSVNRHFHNLALWAGKRYHGESIENPVNVRRLLGLVRQAIDRIPLNQY